MVTITIPTFLTIALFVVINYKLWLFGLALFLGIETVLFVFFYFNRVTAYNYLEQENKALTKRADGLEDKAKKYDDLVISSENKQFSALNQNKDIEARVSISHSNPKATTIITQKGAFNLGENQ